MRTDKRLKLFMSPKYIIMNDDQVHIISWESIYHVISLPNRGLVFSSGMKVLSILMVRVGNGAENGC